MTRRFKDVGDIVRVDRGVWGLKDWYPGRKFVAATRNSKVDECAALPADEIVAAEAGAKIDEHDF